MPRIPYRYRIQSPEVFANCFRRPHFTRKVLEGVFRRNVTSVETQSLEIKPYKTASGEMTHLVRIPDIKFSDNTTATVVIYLDMNADAVFTARNVDAEIPTIEDNSMLYIIPFCFNLPHLRSKGSVMKFTMCDIIGNRLCDRRWEYFVSCKYGDKIGDAFTSSLCKMLRGETCTTDEAYIIEDTCSSIITELGLEVKEPSVSEETTTASEIEGAVDAAEDQNDSGDGEVAGEVVPTKGTPAEGQETETPSGDEMAAEAQKNTVTTDDGKSAVEA